MSLADAQMAVEAVDLLHRRRSGHQGGGGDVADPGARGDAGRLGAEVERRMGRFVPGPTVVRRCGGHPGGDEADARILEVTEHGPNQPGARSTSVSTNATSAVVTDARPALRATAGPALVRNRRRRMPSTGSIGGCDPSSTTTTPATPAHAARNRERRSGSAASAGTTTVTSANQ